MKIKESLKPEIILLDGASGVGKSTILQYLKNEYSDQLYVGSKLTNRQGRIGDTEWEFKFVEIIPKNSKYSFQSVGYYYAIDFEELTNIIKQGITYVISCTDRNTIEKIKNDFPTISIYVYRAQTRMQVNQLLIDRGLQNEIDIKIRLAEYDLIISKYIENINLYDYVILNIGTVHELYCQISNLLSNYSINKIQ